MQKIKVVLFNSLIYSLIFIAIYFNWESSSEDTRAAMFYGLITIFPIVSLRSILVIYKASK
mgnify:FL=1